MTEKEEARVIQPLPDHPLISCMAYPDTDENYERLREALARRYGFPPGVLPPLPRWDNLKRDLELRARLAEDPATPPEAKRNLEAVLRQYAAVSADVLPPFAIVNLLFGEKAEDPEAGGDLLLAWDDAKERGSFRFKDIPVRWLRKSLPLDAQKLKREMEYGKRQEVLSLEAVEDIPSTINEIGQMIDREDAIALLLNALPLEQDRLLCFLLIYGETDTLVFTDCRVKTIVDVFFAGDYNAWTTWKRRVGRAIENDRGKKTGNNGK